MSDTDRVALLNDPVPRHVTVAGQWWPPRWLEPDYLRSRIADIDVLHVHFGFDSTPPMVLSDVCSTLAAHRVPLVVTVHDLCNPHLTDEGQHRARLDVLIREAATVITLTAGAADAIAGRWQRQAAVLHHPHVLPIDTVGAERALRPRPVVGVHAKHLRANVDPWPILDSLTALSGAFTIRLDLDDDALSSPRADGARDRLAHYAAAGVDVRVHPRFNDAQLVDYLNEIDVLVLPYRFGSHSGWVEACHDAGVRAVVPDCGFFHEQHADVTFGFDRNRLDEPSLHRAVETAVRQTSGSAGAVDHERRQRRKAQRHQVRHETVRIYRRLIVEKDAA
ncbi:hypothetical protein [Mycobacterium deserti]|uniref:Glycosyltransferase subfamily 4-like N-terminal domain-containing protein n=1 Tax=Mycobacterium deserti TaxID=2978347 RepID=A0ABT2MFR2_9MYCO|nr:hypothetical protein [Mycobacterium deserti]MCT7661107.1 hypothetical protein [Mycobacterium deserti]